MDIPPTLTLLSILLWLSSLTNPRNWFQRRMLVALLAGCVAAFGLALFAIAFLFVAAFVLPSLVSLFPVAIVLSLVSGFLVGVTYVGVYQRNISHPD